MSFADSLLRLKRVCDEAYVHEAPAVVLLFKERRDLETFREALRREFNPLMMHNIADSRLEKFQLVGMSICLGMERG